MKKLIFTILMALSMLSINAQSNKSYLVLHFSDGDSVKYLTEKIDSINFIEEAVTPVVNPDTIYVPQPRESISFLNPVVTGTQFQSALVNYVGVTSTFQFKQILFEYTSYGPDMKTPVRLTGSISMNEDVFDKTVKPSSVMLYNEFTTAKHRERTSQDEIDDISFLTIKDKQRLIIASDLYGWTLTEDKPQAYCCTNISDKEIIDCYDAAMYVLDSLGYITDSLPLYNVGYSSGALTAMSVQRYVDKSRPDIKFDYTAVGGGPYDLEGIYMSYVETDTTGYICSLPLMVVAYKETYNMPYSYKEIFKSPLADSIQSWILSKDYNTQEINNLIGPQHHISDILTPELCDTTSTIAQAIIQKFRKNSVCGIGQTWQPNTDTKYYVYHSKGDKYIPYSIAQNMVNYLRDHGCTVTSRFSNDGDHVTWGILSFVAEVNKKLK